MPCHQQIPLGGFGSWQYIYICIFYALDKLMQLFEISVTLTKTNWNGTLLELIVDAQVIVRFLFVFPNSVNF